MPVIVPVYVPQHHEEYSVEIAVCQALPTKAETLTCLQKVQEHKDNVDFVGDVVCLSLLVIAILIAWVVTRD